MVRPDSIVGGATPLVRENCAIGLDAQARPMSPRSLHKLSQVTAWRGMDTVRPGASAGFLPHHVVIALDMLVSRQKCDLLKTPA